LNLISDTLLVSGREIYRVSARCYNRAGIFGTLGTLILGKKMNKVKVLTGFVLAAGLLFSVNLQAYKEHAASAHAVSDMMTLEKIEVNVGNGEEAVVGKTAKVHYTGWLYDADAEDKKGKKFDSSHDRSTHFSFLLGSGRVIKGWDQGVQGMKVGGKRTLIIPSSMGYGAQGAGGVIPPNATLVFDVELIGLEN